MAESILPYALTTLQRVKDRIWDTNLSAQPTAFDSLLTRMINGVTDFVERECGNRRFVLTLYTNEIYSMMSARQKKVIVRNAPVVFQTVTGNTSVGSATISAISNTTAMVVGMPIQGDGIQSGAVISAIGTTTITISKTATLAGTTTYFQVNGIISFQFRAGPPSAPNWTAFIPDQFELVNDGKAGILRIYGSLPSLYSNMARVTYSAGYAVNWANAGDGITHQLPASLSDLVENLVVRRFKRRQFAGKQSEGLEGATTSWNKEIDNEDVDVLQQFRRMPTIF